MTPESVLGSRRPGPRTGMLDAGSLNQLLTPGEIRTERRGGGISNLAFYDGKLSAMWLCLHGHAATGLEVGRQLSKRRRRELGDDVGDLSGNSWSSSFFLTWFNCLCHD